MLFQGNTINVVNKIQQFNTVDRPTHDTATIDEDKFSFRTFGRAKELRFLFKVAQLFACYFISSRCLLTVIVLTVFLIRVMSSVFAINVETENILS